MVALLKWDGARKWRMGERSTMEAGDPAQLWKQRGRHHWRR